MPPRPIVFLGPSLARAEARTLVAADFRPPLRKGDLDAAPKGAVIGVVDGVLDAPLRLPRREAARAMERGQRLYGAASTGALLAARLHNAGFVGLGRVFELVARYPAAAEDLVTVLYAEGTAFTEPLANGVLTFIDQVRPVDPRRIDEAISALRTIPIARRTQTAIMRCLQELAPGSAFRTLNDYKAEDARLLLRHLDKPTIA